MYVIVFVIYFMYVHTFSKIALGMPLRVSAKDCAGVEGSDGVLLLGVLLSSLVLTRCNACCNRLFTINKDRERSGKFYTYSST